MFAQPAGASLGLACAAGTSLQDFERTGGKLTGFMDVRSGDPAADCAAEYKRLEGAAPPLLAYSTGRSYLSVLPANLAGPAAVGAVRQWLPQRRDATGASAAPR